MKVCAFPYQLTRSAPVPVLVWPRPESSPLKFVVNEWP
jgi:hypothetical protein